MKSVVLAVMLFASVCLAENFGTITGVFGGDVDEYAFTVNGVDSVRFTLTFSDKEDLVGLHAWFDDLGISAHDSIIGYYRSLPSHEWRTFPVGSPFIPIAWFTDESPWAVSSWLVFTDSAVYSSMIPDSLIGLGSERFAPVAGRAVEFMWKTTAADTVYGKVKAITK